jgi:hypothetical protein
MVTKPGHLIVFFINCQTIKVFGNFESQCNEKPFPPNLQPTTNNKKLKAEKVTPDDDLFLRVLLPGDVPHCKQTSGEGGIRTHGGPKTTTVFETAPIVHSGTSPIPSSNSFEKAKVIIPGSFTLASKIR